ncbi:glycosyl hydrolase family 7-domain-containing protein [Mycena olivaceomarginata]|nr:glycosyl hydrolase family 7-domain-containing protein [Mycena olivaceomarginata]
MDADSGVAKSNGSNRAGAKYGTGYCDAQCPKDINFINGVVNSNDSTPPFLLSFVMVELIYVAAIAGTAGRFSCIYLNR